MSRYIENLEKTWEIEKTCIGVTGELQEVRLFGLNKGIKYDSTWASTTAWRSSLSGGHTLLKLIISKEDQRQIKGIRFVNRIV